MPGGAGGVAEPGGVVLADERGREVRQFGLDQLLVIDGALRDGLSGLRETISLLAKNLPARSKRCTSVRGTCIISPSMAPSDPGRRVYTLEMKPVVGRKMRALSGGEMHPALLVAAALSAAVSHLTVDEIVARHTEARGGAQRLAALQNLKISGKAFFGGGEDFAVTAEFAQVRN